MDRRDFLKTGGLLIAGSACAYGLPLLTTTISRAATDASSAAEISGGLKWGMVVDLNKCRQGCDACVKACRKENNITIHGDPRYDVHLIRKVTVKRTFPVESPEKPMPLLCNQCDNPPCVLVCPVKATHKRPDGIVIVDHHRCIGCRYCVTGCPYNARHFNFKENHDWPNKELPRSSHGVPQSCTFCVHRLDAGKLPACIEACAKAGAGALTIGNLNDPDSEVSQLISSNSVKGLREDLGTKPKVYYIGL